MTDDREEFFKLMNSPDYEDEVREIRKEFKDATEEVQRELDRLDVSEVHKRSHTEPVRKKIKNRLKKTEEFIENKTGELIEKAGKRGVAYTMVALGVAGNFAQAYEEMSMRRLNQNVITGHSEELFDDLLQVTQNMDRRTKRAIRQAAAKASRDMKDQGFTGRRVISEQTAKEIRETLRDPSRSGIIDSSGKRWKPETYADMVTRTKMMDTHSETVMNEAVQRGANYGIISSHGATDYCAPFEGTIIKLTADAPGSYPTYDELRGSELIFHPNCKHTVTPIRDMDVLPQNIRDKAKRQEESANRVRELGRTKEAREELGLSR